MKIRPVLAVLVSAVVVAAVGAGTTIALSGGRQPEAHAPPDPASAAVTSFPGLARATDEPDLPGLELAHPRPGTAVQVSGPFDERYVLRRLVFDGSAATGVLRVTSDVSDILDLEVVAGFYASDGRLIATGRFVHHLDEEQGHRAGSPSELVRFTVEVPHRFLGRASAAAVGVPVLVNE